MNDEQDCFIAHHSSFIAQLSSLPRIGPNQLRLVDNLPLHRLHELRLRRPCRQFRLKTQGEGLEAIAVRASGWTGAAPRGLAEVVDSLYRAGRNTVLADFPRFGIDFPH